MRTYYKNKNLHEMYYRTQPCTTRLQVNYSLDGEWRNSHRYSDIAHTMVGLVVIPMTAVPCLPIANIHKTFRTWLFAAVSLVFVVVIAVTSTNITN